jgi:pyruvate, orthophosphate dikinase
MAKTTHPRRARQSKQASRWIYRFDEFERVQRRVRTRDASRGLLGGKGANLAEMAHLGLPVPPGFTVTTEACRAFLEAGEWPSGLWEQEVTALRQLEAQTGKKFGDPANPLLVSCRSGAKFSMPGMMDTVLNIGLNDDTVQGLATLTHDPRFAWDAYRRLIQMYGGVVLGVRDELFQEVLTSRRSKRGVANDSELGAKDLEEITSRFRTIVRTQSGRDFPSNPLEQLRLATEAVFQSWRGKRAQDYRRAAGIPDDLGTAVNIVAMVFGNMGADSATGVATTRNVSTGAKELEGDFLTNAQGEDVVAGTRTTRPISELKDAMPVAFRELSRIGRLLEVHFRNVQDIEFTVERTKLWMLQTRDAKRSARAAVRIAVEMARERLISREEAVRRITPEQVDLFLHPQFDLDAMKTARADGRMIATGLNVSPGAAAGQLAFDADTAERWAKEKREVIMIRAETKPDDVHGLLAARGVLTSHGGRTSHAALVARQFGKPAVVGVLALDIDAERRVAQVRRTGVVLKEGDWVSIDGTTGEVFIGKLPTLLPSLDDPNLLELLGWADRFRKLEVWANADYPHDAERAQTLGAEGIGLCRTEHMFFQTERLPLVQKLILSSSIDERRPILAQLLPMQRSDFEGLFRAMRSKPVVIRLIDPPLHEFLPAHDELLHTVTELETRARLHDGDVVELEKELRAKRSLLLAVQKLREQNPMLGLRGVRLGIHMPELVTMQVRAIFEAACNCQQEGIKVNPKIMIPLIAHSNELKVEQGMLEAVGREVMQERHQKIRYEFGTMIEVPRAALTADQIAVYAMFFSFGTNDLTQTTFGISRDDAETGFLLEYLQKGVFADNPFVTIDERGVGQLMATAVKLGRASRPGMDIGICGEHGGDPKSIAFCHRLGLTYVSCSPFRVPAARLAAAHAALATSKAAAPRPRSGRQHRR